MKNPDFSFIIITFNEQENLCRLLESIRSLNANTYVLDSGSTDNTLSICKNYHVKFEYHEFENHPRQWDVALKTFEINTPWIIGLDADQIVTPQLLKLLQTFSNRDYLHINGIYFNRKNYFKGKWIKYGGYYPKYLLKMFRYNIGYSDLTELMDHRFQVPGKTLIWKNGSLKEENLKENKISFWINKHNIYSDLLADEEIQRIRKLRIQQVRPNLFGTPNERNAWFKKLWWKLPRYLRPILYLIYRMIFRFGILDGKTGIIYHFLQGFWFRLIVDIKIEERLKEIPSVKPGNKHHQATDFIIRFMMLFGLFYSFNLSFIGLTTKGGFYALTLAQNFNYIEIWRNLYINTTSQLLEFLNYKVITHSKGLSVTGHSGFKLVYSCLGYGIISCFSAFIIAYPKPIRSKFYFLIFGLVGIQLLNTIRFLLISIYYNRETYIFGFNHHDLFNCFLYAILGFSTYLWINTKKNDCYNPQKNI